ncbi:MAG: FtsK/SpoIIIE domain-containing protein [Bacteriovoracia bacterium]
MKEAPLRKGLFQLRKIISAGLSQNGKGYRFYLIAVAFAAGALIFAQRHGMEVKWLYCHSHYTGLVKNLCQTQGWLFPLLLGSVVTIMALILSSFSAGLFHLKKIWKLIRYQKAFETIGLKNAQGEYPLAIDLHEKKDRTECLTVKSKGIGIDRYKEKIRDLEAALGLGIDTFETGMNPSIVRISLFGSVLPRLCDFEKLKDELSVSYSFLVGRSSRETLVQSILSLPHMIIAGMTGGGKSVFFKQVLLGLLFSSPRIQMYLFDLKGGVEMNVFSLLPNIRVYKSADEAVLALQKINKEMDRRLKYLAEKGFSKVDFDRDKFDIIIVGVDEASELYGKSSNKSEQETVEKARELTDRITKLARATGIHVILATQKVLKETIDTKIQENIGGRMVFRMNTLQGSLSVLGNKMALDLPDTAGRAIWTSGSRFTEVQAPYLSEENLKKYLKQMASDFEEGERKNYGTMLEVMTTPNSIYETPTNLEDISKR